MRNPTITMKIADLNEMHSKGTFIVAEIGKNFIQSADDQSVSVYFRNACRLVYAAKEAGADAVKFQTHDLEDEQLDVSIASPHFGVNRYEWVKRNSRATPVDEFWIPLKHYCEDLGIGFFSTPMSRGAARKLHKVGVPIWKIASSDILDFVLLDFVANTGLPIILPAGMSTLAELDQSVDFLRRRNVKFTLLHAISRYPYPPEDSQLLTIRLLQKRYEAVPIGFSQNSPWIEPAVGAVALGASVLEQHFTLDRDLWGPDHKVSMNPTEMAELVRRIRELQFDGEAKERILTGGAMNAFMGVETKELQEGEKAYRPLFRKGLVAARRLVPGETIGPEMMYAMRPQSLIDGLPSECYEEVLGQRVRRLLEKYDPISREAIGGV